MFRPNYGADFLNGIGMPGDTLVRSVAGQPVAFNPADIAQGAGTPGIREGVQRALRQYDDVNTGTQVTASVAQSQSLNPFASWWQDVQAAFNRDLIGLLGIVVVAFGLYFFAKD